MSPLDHSPLAALHGARIDHSSAIAHGLLNAAEHLAAGSLRLHSRVLERAAQRVRAPEVALPAVLAAEVAGDPELQRLGADLFQEQVHLAADLGARWIAYGEWHRQGIDALLGLWLTRAEAALTTLPMFAGAGLPPAPAAEAAPSGPPAAPDGDAAAAPRGRGRRQ